MEVAAPGILRLKLEICNLSVGLLHLDVFSGHCSHTSSQFGIFTYPVEFALLGLVAARAETDPRCEVFS